MVLLERYARWLLLVLACACPLLASAAGPKHVVLLLSDASVLYQETAQAIRAELDTEPGRVAVRSLVLGVDDIESVAPDALIVAIGLKAAQQAAKMDAQNLDVLIARQAFENLVATSPVAKRRGMGAIYLDQPPARHLELIRSSLPNVRNLGVLFGPNLMAQSGLQAEWMAAARSAGVSLVPVNVAGSNELFSALQAGLPGVDALMVLPDPLIVNRGTVQNLMLTTYRQRVPVVGYSQALVEAGSLLAVYSTPRQIGRQAGEMILRLAVGRSWDMPSPAYPKYFSVKSNTSVSRALEMPLPSDGVLMQRLGGGL